MEQRHTQERRHLLNRAIHGWGVVAGFELAKTASGALLIKPGLALDKSGRELLQVEELTRAANELIVLDEKGQQRKWDEISASECWLLSAHYAEQDTDAVKVSDACQCEHMEWNYTCETVRFSLQSMDCAECCKGQGCEWDCECESTGWCDQFEDSRQRGGRACLCDYVAKRLPGSDCDKLCEIDEPCGSVRVDLRNGVPLACVKLVRDNCDGWAFGEVDACGPRRLVKGNDLLFDLIQGCDLTHITEIGWKDWHRREQPIPFDEFSKALGPKGNEQPEYITDAFWVRFSRQVQPDTLRPDCFAMTVMTDEGEGGWLEPFRVPISRLEFREFTTPAGRMYEARMVVNGPWLEDAVRGTRTKFQEGSTRVEIEVRGDFILDCNGQAIDANAVGLSPAPTGNGTPGGTFLSTFRVEAAPRRY